MTSHKLGRSILASSAVTPAWAQTSFEERTIRLPVNFVSAGRSTLARQFAPFVGRNAPGKPTVIVKNRSGAGGMVGANYIFNAIQADGLTIGFLTGIVTPGLIGGNNIRFDPAKFRWLDAVSNA